MIEALKQKLGEEVEKLQYELNVTLPNEIRKAVELGDLRENSEYKAALERQQFVQARLGQLRMRLSKLSSIDPTQIPRDKVGLGSKVVVEDQKTGQKETYYLVFGDALERQQFVQARLGQLRMRLSKLSSIDPTQIPRDKVGLGSKVVVEDQKTGQKETYYLVFGDALEFEEGHVTMASPIGRALLGQAVGDVAFLKLPTMVRQLKVVELKTLHDAEEADV
jgi:transcription elongation factor GreA